MLEINKSEFSYRFTCFGLQFFSYFFALCLVCNGVVKHNTQAHNNYRIEYKVCAVQNTKYYVNGLYVYGLA